MSAKALTLQPETSAGAPSPDRARELRLRGMVDAHYASIGRILRSLGVREADVEDALQQTLVTAASKLDAIREGSERAFLVQVAVHIAARHRRARGRSREDLHEPALEAAVDPGARPDDVLDQQRAMEALDLVLQNMDDDLRIVFVLFEIEEMTMAAIAQTLELPQGTVASRLRRARVEFEEGVRRARTRRGR